MIFKHKGVTHTGDSQAKIKKKKTKQNFPDGM